MRKEILENSYGGVNSLYQFRDDPNNGYEVKPIGNGLYITRPQLKVHLTLQLLRPT